jgi:excisionase family DNA binding protein
VSAESELTLLTADELAARWQVSKHHVYRLARDGRVPCVPIGRYYRFRLAAIEAWEIGQEDWRISNPSAAPTKPGAFGGVSRDVSPDAANRRAA